MVSPLHQLSLLQIIVGAVFVIVVLAVVQHWALRRLNAEPADDLDHSASDKDAEILGNVPVRSKVGTPRPRRLQPVRGFENDSSSDEESMVPADSLAMAGPGAFAKPKETSRPDQPNPFGGEGSSQPAFTPAKSERPVVPLESKTVESESAEGKLVENKSLESKAVESESAEGKLVETKPVESKPVETKPVESKPVETDGKLTALPPLAPDVAPAAAPATPTEKPPEPVAMPPLAASLSPATAPAPEKGAKDLSPLGRLAAKLAGNKDKPAAPAAADKAADASPVAPVAEKIAEGVFAMGAPVSLASAPSAPQAAVESDDVKKRKTPLTGSSAEQNRSRLILIPKTGETAAEVVSTGKDAPTAEAPVALKKEDAPAVKPVEVAPAPAVPPAEPKAEAPAKTGGRPRIFLPANLPSKQTEDAVSAPSPVEAVKPVAETPAPAPVPVIPVESKAPDATVPAKTEIDEAPAIAPVVEIKPEPRREPKHEVKSEPIDEPAPVPPPAEPVTAKAETPAPQNWLNRALGMFSDPTTAKTEPPAPAPKESVPGEPLVPVSKVEEPTPPAIEPEPVPAAPVAAIEAAPAPEKAPEPPVNEPVLSPEPVAASAPTPAPTVPPSSDTPGLAILPAEPVPVPPVAPREVSVSTPQPTMAQNESTTNVPANTRASAQLTLGFEITSLQLTPFFKLGAVQLRPLSKVVGLHLIATQAADTPLAAGISFEIDTVELNEASHIKSILLKPLQGAEPGTVPQSKMQVGAVQIGQGSDGAPISVTSSSGTPTTVQLLATFTIAAMDFTPAFEIGSLRLEPTSNSVLLRLAASSRPASLDLPPSFEVANVQLGGDAQITEVRLTPGGKPA